MNLTSMIEQFLYVVSSALYLPVIGACAVLVLYVPWLAGMLVYDVMARRRGQRAAVLAFRRALAQLQPAGVDRDVAVEWLLQQHEGLLTRALDRVRFVIKVGPALGLMGTLIPMADALQGLAEGNLPALASNMVTAFAATVIGLTISLIAYLLSAVREEWVRADTSAIAFEAERLLQRVATPSVSRVR